MSIRRIIQKKASSCGIACVASVAARTHDQVLAVAIREKIVPANGPFYLHSCNVQQLLSSVGVPSARARMARHWHAISQLAIVAVNHHRESNYWYWVVYVPSASGGYVRDPRASVKASKRTDFGRMRVHSFIPVQPPNYVLNRTVGDMLRSNQSISALGRLARR